MFVLLVVLVLLLDRPPVPEPEPERTVPMHVITMAPEETPEPGPVRYPVPLDDDLQAWIVCQCDGQIDPALVMAVIAVETAGTFDANAVGDGGHSIGLAAVCVRRKSLAKH